MTSTPRPTLNPRLREFWRKPARNRVLYGGRDSSKSWDAAGFSIYLASNYQVRTLCTRQFQNKIEDSVYTLLKLQIDRFGLRKQFAIYNNRIECPETGSNYLFYGRYRNIDEIKGMEGVDVHWGEECHLMTESEFRIIDPTLRKDGSQHWIIFNPRLRTDFVYQNFVVNPPPDTVVRQINYDENPFLSNTSRKIIEHMQETDPDMHAHIYMGVPLSNSENAIIKRQWIEAAVDAHKKLGITPTGARRVGYDVADDGKDLNATVVARGILAVAVDEWKGQEDDLLGSCSRVYQLARTSTFETDTRPADIYYDCIGVGASAGSKFRELNQIQRAGVRYEAFNAGGKVHRPDDFYQPGVMNKDYFANIKAQAWWLIADRFRNTYNAVTKGQKYKEHELISISSTVDHLERLKDELSTPHRDFDPSGKVKVESKKDLAARDVKSPNLADAFIMAYCPLVSSVIDYGKLL